MQCKWAHSGCNFKRLMAILGGFMAMGGRRCCSAPAILGNVLLHVYGKLRKVYRPGAVMTKLTIPNGPLEILGANSEDPPCAH